MPGEKEKKLTVNGEINVNLCCGILCSVFFSTHYFLYIFLHMAYRNTHIYTPRFHLFIWCMARKYTNTKSFTERKRNRKMRKQSRRKNATAKRRRIWIETKTVLNKREHVLIRVENGQCEIVNWFVVRCCESNFVIAKLNRQLHEKTQQLAIKKRKQNELNTKWWREEKKRKKVLEIFSFLLHLQQQ